MNVDNQPTLRPYQARAVVEARVALDRAGRVCLVCPTAGGKTVIAAALAAQETGEVLWLVHRRELAEQAPGRAVTIQSLLEGARPPASLLVLDEAHHAGSGAAPAWHAVAQHYSRILGLTATPQRGDGSPLGDLFRELVVGATYSELLAGGWIVPARVLRPPEEIQGVAQRPADAWRAHAGERRGFAFFGRVDQAARFAAEIPGAVAIHGQTPAGERAEALRRFRGGDLQCLASVGVLTEGIDVPEAEVCLLACDCDHAGSYLQRVGRVLRPAPGKERALVIDLPGVSHRHGLPHVDRDYSLDGRAIRARVEPLTTCQQCGSCYPAAVRPCPECGFAPVAKPASLRVWDLPLAEAVEAARSGVLSGEQLGIVRWRASMAEAPGKQRAWYERQRQHGAIKGWKPTAAKVKFQRVFGYWPPREWG